MAKLNHGQVGQSSHLFQAVRVKGLDDDGNGLGGVGHVAQTVFFEHFEEHLCSVPSLLDIVVVVLELDVEAGLGLAVLRAGFICVQHLDILDQLIQGDHLVAVVKEG